MQAEAFPILPFITVSKRCSPCRFLLSFWLVGCYLSFFKGLIISNISALSRSIICEREIISFQFASWLKHWGFTYTEHPDTQVLPLSVLLQGDNFPLNNTYQSCTARPRAWLENSMSFCIRLYSEVWLVVHCGPVNCVHITWLRMQRGLLWRWCYVCFGDIDKALVQTFSTMACKKFIQSKMQEL